MNEFSFSSIDSLDLEEELLAEKEIAVKDVKLPYMLRNHIVFSPGTHNDMFYSKDLILKAFKQTNWDKQTRYLFLDHMDEKTSEWAGYIDNLNINNDGIMTADLEIWDLSTALKLMGGAKFGISPSFRGKPGNKNIILDGYFKNFSIVVNPAVKTTYLNAEGAEPIQEINVKFEEVKMPETEIKIEENKPPSEIAKLSEELKLMKEELAEMKKKEEYPEPEKELSAWTDKVKAWLKKHPGKNVGDAVKALTHAEKDKEKEEETKEKYPEEEAKEKYKYPEEKAKEKKPEEDVCKKLENLEVTIVELNEKIEKLSEKPKRVTSTSSTESESTDVDKGLLNVFRAMDGLEPIE